MANSKQNMFFIATWLRSYHHITPSTSLFLMHSWNVNTFSLSEIWFKRKLTHTYVHTHGLDPIGLADATADHQRTLMKQGFGTQWVALEDVSPRLRQPTSSAIDFQLTFKRLPVKDDLSEQLKGAYLARHHVGRLLREMAGRQTQETLSWGLLGSLSYE